MRNVSVDKLLQLQRQPARIRNICILAHVDHGKTTLADSLVAMNGIISSKMAGKLRYMDSRKDEQERGITMKSSSITLFHSVNDSEFLINLIDSPGHVDFSSEVSTAVRLCDGAIVVVDVVEGVCAQTKVALRQAWSENIRPVLVLNKIDRLIVEMKLSPLDAHVHLTQILERVNAVIGELFTMEVLGQSAPTKQSQLLESSQESTELYDWSTGLEDEDDSQLYFSPDQGNVVFASAVDGWGFCIEDFVNIYSQKLGINGNILRKTLWGDYYLHGKTKRIMKGAMEKAKKPLFVQFVLENVWAVYDTIVIRKDKEKLQKILDSLNIKLTSRDMRHTDHKVQLQAVCSQWLPLAKTVLDMVCLKLPAPLEITEEKAEKLMCSASETFTSLPKETQNLKSAFINCSSADSAPLIVYISKMFPVERKSLPSNKTRCLTAAEISERREIARIRHAEKLKREQCQSDTKEFSCDANGSTLLTEPSSKEQDKEIQVENEHVFVAFARVFSGCLRSGQEVYVLGPKHKPHVAIQQLNNSKSLDSSGIPKDLSLGQHVTKVEIGSLYLLMGRELEALSEVPAGNVIGIGGLEDCVLKSATLSSTVACPSFVEMNLMAVPILRVAVEPANPQDMPALVKGLRLLNQADACVQVIVQETGEHVLVTAGEVHLERCLDDLRERYAKIAINASTPIVPFCETVVPPPTVDMVNELILDQNTTKRNNESESGTVTVWTPNKQSYIKIRAAPLPKTVIEILDNSVSLLKSLNNARRSKSLETPVLNDMPSSMKELVVSDDVSLVLTEKTLEALETLKKNLRNAFNESGPEWNEAVDQMWSVGPRYSGPNVLLNKIPGYKHPSMWTEDENFDSLFIQYNSSFVNGFQLATLAGPLCEEPMMGVCFIIEDWKLLENTDSPLMSGEIGQPYGPFSGQIMSAVKEGCRKAFQMQPQRLMMAMYSCNIQVNSEVLGKIYAVLGKRHGQVLHGDIVEGSATFEVTAVLPVVESFSFAHEIRKQTSGLASPQLVFSHWEVLDIDPFWTPSTEEEYLHYGEKADSGNRAKKYMNAVRRRKGLSVEEKIVEFAEKQRTLSKKK